MELRETRILLLEGSMDVSFFVPVLKGLYDFNENRKYWELIPIKRVGRDVLSSPIPLIKDDLLLVIHHAGGRNNLPKALGLIIATLAYWENLPSPSVVGIVRDVDTNRDVLEWTKSILRKFSPVSDEDSLLVTLSGWRVRVLPFAIGNVKLAHPNIEEKRELELLLARLAKEESTLTRFSRSIKVLNEDKGSKLTPKDIMHVLAIAKNFSGDSLSGLYRKFVEELIRTQRDVFVDVLNESGVVDFLEKLTR
ncbi:DUF3226 domain-containing protein [Thermococcus sp. 21S9]|uniref:DUF3226 domain-containing protein n=1 Tax=Thermococcus sp. 21S9 TaxID=1638223 RepID=UPI00143C6BAB|nr:DUF3226 domain-containing protein [Thermococcus sp. 21S9]NJE53952.1 DUF3226 domain-containing protein [Thermococcus sp. 21S9]